MDKAGHNRDTLLLTLTSIPPCLLLAIYVSLSFDSRAHGGQMARVRRRCRTTRVVRAETVARDQRRPWRRTRRRRRHVLAGPQLVQELVHGPAMKNGRDSSGARRNGTILDELIARRERDGGGTTATTTTSMDARIQKSLPGTVREPVATASRPTLRQLQQ
jgi:hypothetical protein